MSVTFNPGQREDVAAIKQIFADCYDEVDKWRRAAHDQRGDMLSLMPDAEIDAASQKNADIRRLAAIALTNLETAQMYAVKAVTR